MLKQSGTDINKVVCYSFVFTNQEYDTKFE